MSTVKPGGSFSAEISLVGRDPLKNLHLPAGSGEETKTVLSDAAATVDAAHAARGGGDT